MFYGIADEDQRVIKELINRRLKYLYISARHSVVQEHKEQLEKYEKDNTSNAEFEKKKTEINKLLSEIEEDAANNGITSIAEFDRKSQERFNQILIESNKKRFRTLDTAQKIIADAKAMIEDTIMYLYAEATMFIPGGTMKNEVVEVQAPTNKLKEISYLIWDQAKFYKEDPNTRENPILKMDKKGVGNYLSYNIIPQYLTALEEIATDSNKHIRELEKVFINSLNSSPFVIDVKGEEVPFIITNQIGARRILDVKQYTAMNTLVSTKMVNSMPKPSKKDIPGQYTMQWDIKEKDLVYFAAVDLKNDKNISADTRIDLNDMAIINAIGSLYIAHKKENPEEDYYFIPLDIWRFMNGKEPNAKVKMSPNQEKNLIDRIEKLRRSFFYIDLKSQMQKYGLTFDSRFTQSKGVADDSLLNLTKMAIKTAKNGQITDGYRVNTEPILFTYSRCRKQIITVERSLLNVNDTNMGEHSIAFTNYLLRRVENYRKGFLKSNRLKLETIYKDKGINSPSERVHKERYTSENAYNVAIRKERAKDCKLIDGILKEWKNRKFIKNYVKEGQGEDTIFVFDVANSKMIEDVGALEN